MRKFFSGLIVLGSLLFLTACGQPTNKPVTAKAGAKIVPTLFFHGYGSSINAEKQMANAAVKAGVTQTVIQAHVSKTGQVTLQGNFQADDHHPIVEVGFVDNKNPDYHQAGKWAHNVIRALQKRDQIEKVNLVGHSMGNMAIAFYMLDYGQDKKLPQVQKQVDIAGHFNGILGMDDQPNRMKLAANGRPTKINQTYGELEKLRAQSTYRQVQVLNIFGDLNNGTHSDGDVSNASSQSLRYLVADQAKFYQEKKIVGPNAQHSKLHENKQVDQILIKFLWNK
ncbi:alpha/beta hydrolase [Lapidilactobacillus wuchangensis]|uniref:alpha/beta hydrolase n=1 Tax=Lapidilactobacillus wuchangensis TaxID=2486001 RepID=UPI000F78DE34|nr:alpha/beta hydrolase [Lapidilactobacillus wuchangensis]